MLRSYWLLARVARLIHSFWLIARLVEENADGAGILIGCGGCGAGVACWVGRLVSSTKALIDSLDSVTEFKI